MVLGHAFDLSHASAAYSCSGRQPLAAACVHLSHGTCSASWTVWHLSISSTLLHPAPPCPAGHLLHSVGLHSLAHSPVLDALSNPLVSGVLGAFALLGPGRQLLLDGFKSLAMGNPNMNSLVAVGSTTSFSVGALSVLVPGLGFGTSFLEEPVMLLAFVLLGRALEARAKVGSGAAVHAVLVQRSWSAMLYGCTAPCCHIHSLRNALAPPAVQLCWMQAGRDLCKHAEDVDAACRCHDLGHAMPACQRPTCISPGSQQAAQLHPRCPLLQVEAAADLRGLAHLIPDTARLVLDPGMAPGKAAAAGAAPAVEYLQVATSTVRAGDIVRVLPGGCLRPAGPAGACHVRLGVVGGAGRVQDDVPLLQEDVCHSIVPCCKARCRCSAAQRSAEAQRELRCLRGRGCEAHKHRLQQHFTSHSPRCCRRAHASGRHHRARQLRGGRGHADGRVPDGGQEPWVCCHWRHGQL